MAKANGGLGATLPRILFWDKAASRMSLVNPGDFKKDELLNKLGLNSMSLSGSFGVMDRNEILRRQRTVKFLAEHPEIRDFLAALPESFACAGQLPNEGQAFLNSLWINPLTSHNHFFSKVHQLAEHLRCSKLQLSSEVEDFLRFLDNTMEEAEALENKLGKEMGEELQKATVFHGTLRIRVDGKDVDDSENWSIMDPEIYGYQKYSYHLSGLCDKPKRSKWLDWKVARYSGMSMLVSYMLERANDRRVHNRFADLLIRTMPDELGDAILDFARRKFSIGLTELNEYDDAYFELYFRYNNGKLSVQLVRFYSAPTVREICAYDKADAKAHENIMQRFAPEIASNYLGYSKRELRRIAEKNREMAATVAKIARQSDFSMKFRTFIEQICPEILKDGADVGARGVESRFKWHTIEGLRQNQRFAKACAQSEGYRNNVIARIAELNEIACVVERLIVKSEEWNLPLCFPEILPDTEHTVSFDELLPVHLIGRNVGGKTIGPKDLVPVSLTTSLNGRMIGLTGQNAGGKTVIAESIVSAIYLAQSGLPVFGVNFALNVKSALGMVFLERGQGSTVELLLRKTANILGELKHSRENGMVVFLDEVGTGTQESAGLEIGERILDKFSRSGCSIIFSTQITALAQKAQDEMNALCFQVDLKHKVSPGIGEGGAELLVKQLGMEKLLN